MRQFPRLHMSLWTDRLFFNLLLRSVAAALLLLTPSSADASQVIVASVGGDVVLPCHLDPPEDASDLTVEWSRADLTPRFVHVRRGGVELESKKNPWFEGRTSLLVDELRRGDVSLQLRSVKVSDEGFYRCFVPTLGRETSVRLCVGVVSSVAISIQTREDLSGDEVELQCRGGGWSPEPEVLWLDAEGHLLSAGPTETVRGPDDLYTVSSRVTVEKRHSNSFTCRVHQKDTNLTRDTSIRVSADVFLTSCSFWAHVSIVLAVGFSMILAVIFFFIALKMRRNNGPPYSSAEKTTEDQEEKVDVISILKNQRDELKRSRDELESELMDIETKKTENLQKHGSKSISRFYKVLKENANPQLLETSENLEKRKTEAEERLKMMEGKIKTLEEIFETIEAKT